MLKKTSSAQQPVAGAKIPAPAAAPLPAPAKGAEVGRAGTFGSVAVELGFITQAQLEEAIREQSSNAMGNRFRLGEILIKKGYLTAEQLLKVQKGQAGGRKRIGDFELISKLGEGGMGSVFKARQLSMDRIIALKLLSKRIAKDPDFRERFVREARSVAKLNHPHIVTGIDVGASDGYCYFAMEYVDGESLGQYMHRMGGKLPEAVVMELIRQIALALQHAHESNMIHRDIKPDNILLDKTCSTAKLVDLGLARSVENASEDASLTQAGQCVGTPFYISPEQARGISNLTGATDLYSLGGTLYHALTGKIPFEGTTAAVIMTRHLTDPIPSARKTNPAISIGADRIVTRLLQKSPNDRYASAKDLVVDIERVQEGSDLDPEVKESAPTNKRGKPKITVPVRSREEPAPVKGLKIKERPAIAVKPKEPKIVVKEPKASREREEDSEEDDENDRSSTGPARSVRRRRKRQQGVSTGIGVLLLGVIVILLYLLILKPLIEKSDAMNRPPPQAAEPPRREPRINRVVEEAPPPASPAQLEDGENGGRQFKSSFNGKLEHFDVDPDFGMAGRFLNIVSDPQLKKGVLRLARVRHKDSACMARLLLPPDLVISKTSTLSFMIRFGPYSDANPEVQVAWDHIIEGEPRALSKWKFTTAKTGWKKFDLPLATAKAKLPSRQHQGEPQFISIFAGKPDEEIEVFIDAIEIQESPTVEKPAPPVTPADKEAPVAPGTKDTKEEPVAPAPKKEAPVVPPRKNAAPDSSGDAVRNAL